MTTFYKAQGISIFVALYFSVGCTSLSFQSNTSLLRDSALSNLSPAPPSMSPSSMTNDKATIDETYMRSQADYHFTLAEALSLDGKHQGAVEHLKLTLVYDPQSALVRLRLAAEYIRLGLLTEAMEEVQTALEMEPSNTDGRMLLGGLYSAMKMFDLALGQYEAVLQFQPEYWDAVILKGAILAEQENYPAAIGHFEEVLAADRFPEPEKIHYYIARIQLERGGASHLRQAQVAFIKALEIKPEFTEALLSYASLLQHLGQVDQAIQLLANFQNQYGPDHRVAELLSRAYLESEEYDLALPQLRVMETFDRSNLNVKVQIALILIEQKDLVEAGRRLEDILAVSPDLDRIRYYLGAVYEEQEEDNKAIRHYLEVPVGSTYYPEAMIHATYLYKKQGKSSQAMSLIRKAIEQRDDAPQFYAFYASLLDESKEYQRAADMLSSAIQRFPEDTQLHFFLGSLKDRLGDSEGAIVQMKRVLELAPDHVQALNFLAYTYAELNINLESAEEMARKALSMSPNDGYILDTVGWILFKKGEVERSIRYLEAAYVAQSDESIIAEHLGDAYFRYQLLDKAKQMYKKAVDLETDKSKILRLKEKIAAVENQNQDIRSPASTSTSFRD